ncbi:MAG: VCBS repeat-containing protein [Opitutaceae bacterium]|nr:VCBS repeat-containing protein [Opitutaceae bacterium]
MKCFLTAIATFALPLGSALSAAEFLVAHGERTFAESDRGFHYYHRAGQPIPSTWPQDWRSPENYWEGTWHLRVVLGRTPLGLPITLQPCIWMHDAPGVSTTASELESCSTLKVVMDAPGVYTMETRCINEWWHKNKGANAIDISRPQDFKRMGMVLRNDQGCYISPIERLNPKCWDDRAKYLPFDFHLTIVAVSQGAVFSGWESYPVAAAAKPVPSAPPGDRPKATATPAPQRATWMHFSIDPVLPGSRVGTAGLAVADFDGDGDLDVAIARVDSGVFWYERVTDSLWIPHFIAEMRNRVLGGTALDVNRDGAPDIVVDGHYFLNPGTLGTGRHAQWEMRPYKGGGHDIVAADMDGDGKRDLVIYDGKRLAWHDPSRNFHATIISSGYLHHAGVAPSGVGDIDGDGWVDVVIPGHWFKHPGRSGRAWARQDWPYTAIENATYGPSIRSWVADLDGDGDNDIVYSDCDTGNSRVYWVENRGKGQSWTSRRLEDPPTAPGDVPGTGSFHSLGVADFDGDGRLDIFAGEQEDPTPALRGKLPMKPAGLKERGIIWYNRGGRPMAFEIDVIQVDNPGWHDAVLADVDGDGDLDIVTKVWKADGPAYHLDYWRNDGVKGRP